jgi:hypothetical protein
MTLAINDTAPDFEAQTTEGKIRSAAVVCRGSEPLRRGLPFFTRHTSQTNGVQQR